MEKYFMKEELTKEQEKKFDALDDNKLYQVVKDYQGGEFGMHRTYTLKEWIHQAFEWLDMDDYFEEDQVFVNYLLDNPDDALNQISDFWQIEFAEVDRKEEFNRRCHEVFESQEGDYYHSIDVNGDKVIINMEEETSNGDTVIFDYEPDMTDRPQALDYLMFARDEFHD